MVRSIVAVFSVLSLLLYTHAATTNVRQGRCYQCPAENHRGAALTHSQVFPKCCYGATYGCCTYDPIYGDLISVKKSSCPKDATPC